MGIHLIEGDWAEATLGPSSSDGKPVSSMRRGRWTNFRSWYRGGRVFDRAHEAVIATALMYTPSSPRSPGRPLTPQLSTIDGLAPAAPDDSRAIGRSALREFAVAAHNDAPGVVVAPEEETRAPAANDKAPTSNQRADEAASSATCTSSASNGAVSGDVARTFVEAVSQGPVRMLESANTLGSGNSSFDEAKAAAHLDDVGITLDTSESCLTSEGGTANVNLQADQGSTVAACVHSDAGAYARAKQFRMDARRIFLLARTEEAAEAARKVGQVPHVTARSDSVPA